ncbi:MAG: DUF4167 domain-containing protein [Phenylobacterium sp.]|uniref:DUF4167 domain-containing protein n=1 Tax=Phenylobacterium sp. TaxID=1871053 RepID=UPI00391C149B
MRDFKGMKRQRGRNRGGGGKPQQNANRAFESNGPDGVKVRGNAQHVFEKYQQLARDAASAGDRVLAENYLQHAEHYFRLVRAIQPQRPAAEILGRDQFASGYDIDFEDEVGGQSAEASEGEGEGAEGETEARREREDRSDRQRDDRQRDDRQRDDRPRDERPRDERPREEGRQSRRDRWRDRDDRRDRQDRQDREPREPRDPLAVVEPQGAPLVADEREAGRTSPMLRDAEGGESHAPAFLQARPAAPAEGGEEPARKPRRRRAPRSFEGGADAPSGETEEA